MANGNPSTVQVIATVFSAIAAVGSCVAAYESYSVNKATYGENVNYNAIRDSYNIFFDLDRLALDNWQLGYLFATPDQYQSRIALTQKSWKTGAANLAELQLKERIVADRIFDSYEETLFLLDRAGSSDNPERVRFLKRVVDYYQGSLLRNPRLLYLWPMMSGGYEKETRDSYEAHVLKDPPPTSSPDANGPFTVQELSPKTKTRRK